jgi:hypothetical protein
MKDRCPRIHFHEMAQAIIFTMPHRTLRARSSARDGDPIGADARLGRPEAASGRPLAGPPAESLRATGLRERPFSEGAKTGPKGRLAGTV